jgi:hypothetical protein
MSTIPGVLGRGQAHLFDPDVSFETEDYAIGGQMLVVKIELDNLDTLIDTEDYRQHIRQKLAMQLALAMLDNALVETTAMQDPGTGRRTIAARCYLAPRDQVKILRVHKR